MFFAYYSVAREVFGVFGCTVYDGGDDNWYLNYRPWIRCSPASNEYQNLLIISVPIFLFFLVGFPVFVWVKMRYMIERPGCEYEARYGFLYMPYKEVFKIPYFAP